MGAYFATNGGGEKKGGVLSIGGVLTPSWGKDPRVQGDESQKRRKRLLIRG